MDKRKEAVSIFLSAVESVKPDKLIRKHVILEGDELRIEKLRFNLSETKNIFVAGAGKASALMAKSIENVLKARIADGHIIVKYGHGLPLKYIGLTEAGHPIPDEQGLSGTAKIVSIAQMAGEQDLFIFLISGGGSSLLTDVPEGCTLDDLKALNDVLLKCGADISEINCIRKHLSKVKGGHLAKTVFPARTISLILSDVIGDSLDSIASGPTAPDPTTFTDALAVIEKYKIWEKIPSSILQYLLEGQQGKQPETLKKQDPVLNRTYNLVIGNNKIALEKAKEKAESLGYESHIMSATLQGDVSEIALYLIKLCRKIYRQGGKKICLLLGGEPTVRLTGDGKGGRNQHLALLMSSLLKDMSGFTFLSCGTDGTDGPTDAAGAVIDGNTIIDASRNGLDVQKFIYDNNSYNFFDKVGGLVKTGATQTNVMDLIVILMN